MGNKYRIPNEKTGRYQFTDFKTYIKFYGLDVITYDTLNTKQKRIWNGVNQSEKQFKNKKGQIISNLKIDQFKKVYNIKEIAKAKNIDPNELLRSQWDTILKASEGKIDYLPTKNFDTMLKLLNDNKNSTVTINGKKYTSQKAAELFASLKNKISEYNIGQNFIIDNISVTDFFGKINIDSPELGRLLKLIKKFDKNKNYQPTEEEEDIEGILGSSDPRKTRIKEKRDNKKYKGFRKH